MYQSGMDNKKTGASSFPTSNWKFVTPPWICNSLITTTMVTKLNCFLNGRSLGTRNKIGRTSIRWRVPYEAVGKNLKAISKKRWKKNSFNDGSEKMLVPWLNLYYMQIGNTIDADGNRSLLSITVTIVGCKWHHCSKCQ